MIGRFERRLTPDDGVEFGEDLAGFSSNLPLVIVNSFGTNIGHDQKVEGAIQFVETAGGRAILKSASGFSGRALKLTGSLLR